MISSRPRSSPRTNARASASGGIRENDELLSERLERLTREGLVTVGRDPSDGRRKLYAPTESAIALIPVLVELAAWGLAFTGATDAQELIASVREDRDAVLAALIERARSDIEGASE